MDCFPICVEDRIRMGDISSTTQLGTLMSSSPSPLVTGHHNEDAPLTVALISGERHFGLTCCARQRQGCQIHRKLFLF